MIKCRHPRAKLLTRSVIMYQPATSLSGMGLGTCLDPRGPPQTAQSTIHVPETVPFSLAPLFMVNVRNYLLSRQFSCLSRLVVVSLSLELPMLFCYSFMISQRFVLPSALGSRAVNRLKLRPHNGPYLRLLKILYVTFYRGTRRSLVEFLVKFSVSFFV